MIYKIDRRTFNDCIGDPIKRKALAFAVFVKNKKPTSVIKGWSYRELSRISGLSVSACRGRISILRQLHLVREEEGRLIFKKLRRRKIKNKDITKGEYHTPKGRDIDIRAFSVEDASLRDIERGIEAMLIVEIQKRKDFIRQLISSCRDPKNTAEIRRAKRSCRKRGYENFSDDGLSYKGIAKRLHCGMGRVTEIIRFGEGKKMFKKIQEGPIALFAGIGLGEYAHEISPNSIFHSYSFFFVQSANRFVLPERGTILDY